MMRPWNESDESDKSDKSDNGMLTARLRQQTAVHYPSRISRTIASQAAIGLAACVMGRPTTR